MKKILFFFCSVLFLTSCEKETSDTEPDEIVAISLKGKPNKVSICHYNPNNDTYKTMSVNEKQLARHLEHGDKRAPCGYTFVPDDVFEQNLINLGFDDVLDDFVLTENIEDILVLVLVASGNYINTHQPINDYTGLEDFVSLRELTLHSMANSLTSDIIDLASNPTLKKLVFYQTDFNSIDLSGNEMLEEIRFNGTDEGGYFPCRISNLDLSTNINLKKLSFLIVNYIDDLNFSLERAPSIEEFLFTEKDYLGGTKTGEISFVNNPNLRKLNFGGDCLTLEFIDLKNGNNLNLESISINPLCHISSSGGICIEADQPTYIGSITTASDMGNPIPTIVTVDCGI